MAFARSHAVLSRLVLLEDCGDGVVKLVLNNQDILNALTVPMGDAFVARVEECRHLVSAGDVRAVVLAGSGRAFSAGGDLAWLMERSCIL